MKDRFKISRDRQRMNRVGSERANGETPREFRRPWEPRLSKAQLRALAAEAFANTATIRIRRISQNKRAAR